MDTIVVHPDPLSAIPAKPITLRVACGYHPFLKALVRPKGLECTSMVVFTVHPDPLPSDPHKNSSSPLDLA